MDPNPFCEGCGKDKGMFLKVLVLEGFLVVPKKNVFVVAVPNPKQKTNNVFTHELKFGSAWACFIQNASQTGCLYFLEKRMYHI